MENVPQILSVNIGDTDLQYLYYHGRGRAMIMLHATGFLPWLWHPIARELARDYRIIAPYFCNHREADPRKDSLSWMKLADDLCQFCERLNITSPVMVGHSMGATVMTIAEATHGLQAGGMVLIEPIFLPRNYYKFKIKMEEHPLASKAVRRRNFWRDLSEAKAYLKGRELFRNWDEEIFNLYLQHGMVESQDGLALACSPEREASLFMGDISFNPWPILPKITCPALVLEGEKSVNRSLIDLKAVANELPSGSYRLVADAGHLIPMEKPREVIKFITDFLISL